ncbi:MAG: prepilin peptidase [Armatimonadota bacterium]|nr:prepilin peptidase [Armatimonadota bacterium]MDR7454809.1 prepilin peptidase [Armatimonadota bacterium]MDR7497736.1 prepilin peptidase [Armatimonadota bacterium]
MTLPEVGLAAVAGAILGSFANVLIYRMPRGESIVTPASRCPRCGTPIRAADNVPLVSYLLLRGRCRSCGERIAGRYPLVEGLMAALAAAAWATQPDLLARLSALALAFLLLVITFIDLDHQLILNRLSYPGVLLGLGFAAAQGRLVPAVLAALGAGGLIAAIVILSRGGMGEGDIKLAAMIGAFLGWPGVAVALFAAFLVGGLVGVGLLALRLRRRRDAIPFGPALAAGALVALFWGERLWAWYWSLGVPGF